MATEAVHGGGCGQCPRCTGLCQAGAELGEFPVTPPSTRTATAVTSAPHPVLNALLQRRLPQSHSCPAGLLSRKEVPGSTEHENKNNVTHHITRYSKLQCSATKVIAKTRNYRKSNSTDICIAISLWVFSGLNGQRVSKNWLPYGLIRY